MASTNNAIIVHQTESEVTLPMTKPSKDPEAWLRKIRETWPIDDSIWSPRDSRQGPTYPVHRPCIVFTNLYIYIEI